jgi:Tfp pilus assembly protein PilF
MSSHHNSTALAAAEECLRKAVAVDPTYYEALLMLAELIITSTYLRLVDNSA